MFWKGLLYNQKNIDILLDYTKNWNFQDVKQLFFKVIHDRFKIKTFKNKNFNEIIKFLLYTANNGLNKSEQKQFLKFIDIILNKQKTISELEIENYLLKKTSNLIDYLVNDYEASLI